MNSDETLKVLPDDYWESMPFEELCHHARPVLRSIVEARLNERVGQRVDASDIVQETLLEVHRRFDEFKKRRPMHVWSWLRETALQQLRIAVRRHQTAECRTMLRQISSDQSSIQRLVEELTAVVVTSEMHAEDKEQSERTRQALFQMAPLDCEVLMLRYLHGFSNQEVADLLGVTEAVASKRHGRALLRLQKILEN